MSVHSFTLADLKPRRRYKLLSGVVVPRPIALVGTLGPDGTRNAAPYSFFNVVSEDPALVVLGLQVAADGTRKDTAANIARTGEFVVNLADEAMAEAMNICAVELPPEESEIDAAGLALAASVSVAPERIFEAPVTLECRRVEMLRFGERRDIVIGEVSHVHVRTGLINPDTLDLDLARYRPLGRLFASLYARMTDRFPMPRMSLEDWRVRSR